MLRSPLRAWMRALSVSFASGVLIVALPAAAATVGSGNVQTQSRAAADFQSIALSGSMRLVVRQSGSESVEVKADDNLLPLIETVVENDGGMRTLHVRWKRGESIRSRGDPVVTVDVKDLKSLASSGSGDIRVEPLKTDRFSLGLSGSSDARLASIAVGTLAVRISGSGDVVAGGRADRLEVKISGSGDVRAADLPSDDVAVSIAGSGDVAVTANKSLDVSIAGSGDVVYAGNPTTVNNAIAGSGSLKKR